MNASSDLPVSLKEHVDAIWRMLIWVGGVALFLAGTIVFWFVKRQNIFDENQKKVMSTIPKEALENGYQLIMCKECARLREGCEHIILEEEVKEGMKVLREAIHIIILYSPEIPANVKGDIVRDLTKGDK